jgi:hypothetical protein
MVKSILPLAIAAGLVVSARAQRAAPPPADPVRIGIVPFSDASGSSSAAAASGLARLVVAEMARSAPALLGRLVDPGGVRLDDIDEEKAIGIGRKSAVDVVLVGTVLDAKSQESSKNAWLPSIKGQSGNLHIRSVKADVVLDAELYSPAARRRIVRLRADGHHTDSRFRGTAWTSLGSWDGGGDGVFMESPLGKAVQDSVVNLVKQLAAARLR